MHFLFYMHYHFKSQHLVFPDFSRKKFYLVVIYVAFIFFPYHISVKTAF